MTDPKLAYEKAEQKATDAHSTAVHMCNDRAWAVAARCAEAAEQTRQVWIKPQAELYTGSTADAKALTALADTLDNGNAFAAQVCRKVARYIKTGNGEHLSLRYQEIVRAAQSYPQATETINGLTLVKLGNDWDTLTEASHKSDELQAASGNPILIMLEIGAAINAHPFTVAKIAAQHADDQELDELRPNDTPGLAQEWRERAKRRTAKRHPNQPRYGLQFVTRERAARLAELANGPVE